VSAGLQAIRGMNDILPGESYAWLQLENKLSAIVQAYGYQQIRMPLLEKTELFHRGIGEVTDIVEKEMYTFDDRNGDSLTLRPEGTASCVRAALEHGLLHNQTQRLWYLGPMFRHERPQAGRYRQFHQLGVETFGFAGPDIDAELIALSNQFWQALGITPTLQINSLGTAEDRQRYRAELVKYFEKHQSSLDGDSQRRLTTNPLRILDSKNPDMAEMLAAAPRLLDYLSDASQAHFQRLRDFLDIMNIGYDVNPRLVRGLDYYSHTVFEWVSGDLGAQATVCAGGRYDGLVTQLGGKAVPASGFAIGLERLLILCKDALQQAPEVDFYIVVGCEAAEIPAMQLATQLRQRFPGLSVISHCGGGSMKSQFKRADKSQAKVALILGEQELKDAQIGVKYLRSQQPQKTLNRPSLLDSIEEILASA